MEFKLHLAKGETDSLCHDKTEVICKALQVPEILEAIFKHLGTERLKRCRGVCLAWSNEIARLFHTRVVPVVSYADWSTFQEQLDHRKGLRLLCPFQELDTTIKLGASEPRSSQWLKSPLPIARLTLYDCFRYNKAGDDPELPKRVLRILRGCSETLNHLTTPFWSVAEETASFKLPQLRTLVAFGYESRPEVRQQDNQSQFSEPELSFFLLVISSAPKLSTLSLRSLSAFPELLSQASLKRLENLEVCGCINRDSTRDTWGALNQIDTEALKTLRVDSLAFFELGSKNVRERELFLSRFSNSLESLRFRLKLCRLPVCPRVKSLQLRMGLPMNLTLFPSLKQVIIIGDILDELTEFSLSIPPCPTVSDVTIDGIVTDKFSFRKTLLLKQLLRLFPSATFWRVNYSAFEDFCEAAGQIKFPIERLEVHLNCIIPLPFVLNRSSSEEAAQADLRTFSNLRLLTNLRELDLRQDLECPTRHYQGISWPEGKKLLPFNIGGIMFRNLTQLRTLRIYADSFELPHDLNTIQDSNISVELIIPSLGGPPNWSDSIVAMSNVTILCEKKGCFVFP